jgi:hypothetical protein
MAEMAKVETSPVLLLLSSPLAPLTYITEAAGDSYHVVIVTNICVKRIARQLVWKKVNRGSITAVRRCGMG